MAVGFDGEAVFEEEEEEEEELQKNPKAVAGTSASGGIIQQVVHL